jgi:hypothetical protein
LHLHRSCRKQSAFFGVLAFGGFFDALGIEARHLEFSSDSSADHGHYGELPARAKQHRIDVLAAP